jgi:hypothetical protein
MSFDATEVNNVVIEASHYNAGTINFNNSIDNSSFDIATVEISNLLKTKQQKKVILIVYLLY